MNSARHKAITVNVRNNCPLRIINTT